jgi:diguanylate cyclase (GGDEF)-like protein
MLDDTEDDIRPSHFRYARRNESSTSKTAVVPANPHGAETPTYSSRVQDLSPYAWTAFGVLGVVVIMYFISLLLRSPTQNWTWLDGWVVCAIELSASIICIVRGLDKNPGRVAPLALGLGLLSWSLGDVFLTIESLGGTTPSVPSVADVFYIGFYPLAYVATVQLLRTAMGRLSRPNWLDGIVAGLGAAAICAAFAFHSILHAAGGSVATAATNLAYPIGDLLLLSLVIGGTVLLSGRSNLPWFLLAIGITLNVIGDTANLFSSSTIFATKLGTDLNAVAWPASLILMSMSVWLKPRTLDPLRTQRIAGVTLPSAAAGAGLAILLIGYVHTITWVALWLSATTLVVAGLRLTLSARDLRILTEERHRLAQTDELTGLGNRRYLFHVLETFFGDYANPWTNSRHLAFLFIDLNRFKEINDSFGHPAGDELLRQLGPRLRRAVPSTGSVFRLGGDELAVVLVDADAAEAQAAADRILLEICEPFILQKMKASVGASIGIALAPSDASDPIGLTWCADTAMYRAKLGNVPCVFYDHEIDGGEQKLNLVEELRVAVDEGNFVLHYQPLLNLHTGEILAVEALIRWPHATLGLVPPLKFLPLAEDAGLMQELTKWVLSTALAQCATWRDSGRTMTMSVNITTTNLLEEGFTELVASLLHQHDLSGNSLVIEITESSIITDFARSKTVIEALKTMGVVVSIDDFGAGFTSLAYLSSLAVGELKLDQAFITGLSAGGKERDLELVRATIQLGHDMELRVVAEGIEDVDTLNLLSDLGCDIAQGYFISRPMPAHKLSFQQESLATPAGVTP